MRTVQWAASALLLGSAFSACLLPSFEKVDEQPTAQGGAVGSAGAPTVSAGDENQAGEAGASGSPPPAPVDDVFSMLQGGKLKLAAPGVLENDAGSSLTVSVTDDTDTRRPAKYDAASLNIDADGALIFEPQADFFGTYSVQYTVLDKDGLSATANVTIHVQPVNAKLATVRDGIGGFVIDGAADDGIGAAIAGAGDVNNDGFDDIAVGAPAAGDNGAGRAYLVYGRAKSAAVSLKPLTAKSTERTFVSFDGADGDGVGNSVAGIGDLNKDGYSDFALAASKALPSGAVYVLYGGTFSGGTALANLSAARGVTLTSSGASIGNLISRAGDVNGDGTPDLLISAALNNGRVYAVLGSDKLKSSDIDALPNLRIDGDLQNEALPQSLDYVGNVNSDGRDEIVVASQVSVTLLLGTDGAYPAKDNSSTNTNGAAGGWHYDFDAPQSPPVAGAGNVDGDAVGTDDLLICEVFGSDPLTCRVVFSPPVLLDAGWSMSGFSGQPRVTHGADINGDGFSDLVFGDGARAEVVFGKRSGHSPVDVSALGDAGFSFETEDKSVIDSVATIGDVNGDGIADYAVGVSSANAGTGSIYVIFGEKY